MYVPTVVNLRIVFCIIYMYLYTLKYLSSVPFIRMMVRYLIKISPPYIEKYIYFWIVHITIALEEECCREQVLLKLKRWEYEIEMYTLTYVCLSALDVSLPLYPFYEILASLQRISCL